MSWTDYQARLLAANPRLTQLDARLTMSVGEFLRQLKRAYADGEQDQQRLRAAEDFGNVRRQDPIYDFLDGIFQGPRT